MFVIYMYNRLLRYRVLVQEAYSGMDIQLKKRYDLIPDLVASIKGYMEYEEGTLNSVISARQDAVQAKEISEQQNAEQQLNSALTRMFALAEQYPTLKASQNFLHLQNELGDIEDTIEKSRRYYNGSVREYNYAIQSFPQNIIANIFKFKRRNFFELNHTQHRISPGISFDS